jgi:hypothetical protein
MPTFELYPSTVTAPVTVVLLSYPSTVTVTVTMKELTISTPDNPAPDQVRHIIATMAEFLAELGVDLDEVLREQALEAAAADIMQLPEIDHEVEALLAKLDAAGSEFGGLYEDDEFYPGYAELLGGDFDDEDDDFDDDDEETFEAESEECHELLDDAGIRKGTLTDRIRTLLQKRSR